MQLVHAVGKSGKTTGEGCACRTTNCACGAMLLCGPCPLHAHLSGMATSPSSTCGEQPRESETRASKARKLVWRARHSRRKKGPKSTRQAVPSVSLPPQQAGGECAAGVVAGWAACLCQHVGRRGAVDGAADGLAGAQDLLHCALQLACHAARPHDASDRDHVVQRQVPRVCNVLDLRTAGRRQQTSACRRFPLPADSRAAGARPAGRPGAGYNPRA